MICFELEHLVLYDKIDLGDPQEKPRKALLKQQKATT
jgi:hypothetical protein